MSRIVYPRAALLVTMVLVAALFATQNSVAAPSNIVEASPAASPRLAAAGKRADFTVKPGVTFNSATGSLAKRRTIISKVNAAITHARKGSEIRIFSWKIWTRPGVTALLKAQQRGVVVHAIMDKKNTIVERNPHFWRLKRGLRDGNKRIPKARWSGARLCDHSCRGKGGASHSKFMLFSKSGRSEYVYMHGSANWGDAAASRQWNDMYTFVGNKGIYDWASARFDEAWKDEPVKGGGWSEYETANGSIVLAMSPTTKKSRADDRLLGTLRKVKCRGATDGAGNANGRTIIRSAPDVIRGDRGMAVARELRRLWDRGCDVKVGYTVMGYDVGSLFKRNNVRGPVPIRHLTQDFDGDGVFDRYFHLKAYTINGVIGSDTSATWLLQGSANTSGLAQVSDETFAYFIDRPAITKRYQNHITFWFDHYPSSARLSPRVAGLVATNEIDPYATMDLD